MKLLKKFNLMFIGGLEECDQKVGNIWWKNEIYLNLNQKWFEMSRKDYISIIFIKK